MSTERLGTTDGSHDAYVVWLHGLGDSPAGWAMPCAIISDRLAKLGHAKLLWELPEAPVQPVTCNGGHSCTSWMDLATIPVTPGMEDTGKDLAASIDIVTELIEAQVAKGIPRRRVIVGGFSQGGALSLTAALKQKEPVAAACVLSGWAPPSANLAAEAERVAAAPAPTQFLLCHGAADGVVVPPCGQEAAAILEKAGLPSALKIYPGMAHSSCGAEIDDIVAFIDKVLKAAD
mmetsp:Transcript_4860/g.12493  ORF Transcript_4860/g.12493 Transcript_4860/m.12493 type:complete len:233 (+) Transcript_4860:33-731(+)|eukprot:CAMPEP_0182927300 /NCGR_PEP_ID=MMETSP0105_2-20130417/13718_1 /TAXON_ID=81532 ORGANISM="Acanthoeca-like sp., Strain 10tr" /NCGR_SAMPLE_ID=MMETSP0105_2 /ASSEMBLY_ACC=CAM_ASM_000205 /LENGTH=232 /DNA_ID=CAMNT_0025065245 /DNA_START=33 /DNA_END=731 /DNA_ORIENTATION=-